MTFALPAEGGCQCGGVRYRISGEPLRMAICHCRECQKQSGSAFGMSVIVRQDDFELLQGTVKSFDRIADTGRKVTGCFCPDCGCRIYHIPTWQDGVFNVRAGTLDDTTAFRPSIAVWTRRQADWVSISGLDASFADQTGSSPLTAGRNNT